jgi:hypothetical protein
MLFPLVGVVVVGLTALFIVKPWRKNTNMPRMRTVRMTVEDPAVVGDLVRSPQARHQLHEEIAQDMANVERIIHAAKRKASNLAAVDDLIQTTNGGNF